MTARRWWARKRCPHWYAPPADGPSGALRQQVGDGPDLLPCTRLEGHPGAHRWAEA